jgi:hypothetical protein
MENKNKILVVGTEFSDAMREKITKLVAEQNAEVVYVENLEQAKEKFGILYDKQRNTIVVSGNNKQLLGKTAMGIAAHMGVGAQSTDLVRMEAGLNSDKVVLAAPSSLGLGFDKVYGTPLPPEPMEFKNYYKNLPQTSLIQCRDDDVINGTRKKHIGRHHSANQSAKNIEKISRKKKRSQKTLTKKARKNNRKK